MLLPGSFPDTLKQLLHSKKDYTWLLRGASNSVCLSTPGRSISKDSGIVPVKDAIEEASCRRFVNFPLAGILIENLVECESLVFHTFTVGNNAPGEFVYRVVFRRIEYPFQDLISPRLNMQFNPDTYRHLSSMTFTIDRRPFWFSFGVGAPAREPSPRNSGPSSHFVICAASLIVNGLTLTATVIEEESLGGPILSDSCRETIVVGVEKW